MQPSPKPSLQGSGLARLTSTHFCSSPILGVGRRAVLFDAYGAGMTRIMPTPRHLGIISTTRADAGIYRPLIVEALRRDHAVTCFVGGTHGSERFGRTIAMFHDLPGAEVVDLTVADADHASSVEIAGATLVRYAEGLREHFVDLLFVLGDRSEMLTATMAAVMLNRRVAHLHGGDETHGAYDDKFRNAISQLAGYHLPALPAHAQRLEGMGIPADRIRCVGALALDAIANRRLPSDEMFEAATGLRRDDDFYTVLFHPETRSELTAATQVEIVITALKALDGSVLILGVNCDVGSDVVAKALATFAKDRPNRRLVPSVEPDIFYECLNRTRCLIGNSSSGIIEAASLQCPVVNIGLRQAGRARAENVIDVPFDADAILQAISRAEDGDFRDQLTSVVNPYGTGQAASDVLDAVAGWMW